MNGRFLYVLATYGPSMTGIADTLRVRMAEPVPAALVAVIITVKEPTAVGIPLMIPVAGLTDRPPGKPDAPKLVGLLSAVIA